MSRDLSIRKGSLIFLLLLLFSLMGMVVAPLAVQAAPVQVADPETVYIVQRGDTLSAIARRYGVTVQALVSYNSLSSTTIYVGQRLLIPGQPAPTYPITYIVQRGDTLYKIACRYDTTVAALMQVNNLRSETIYVGQRLTISVANDPNQPLIYHTVQRGDTLSAIARRYNVSVAAIRATNGLMSDTIYVGQRLLIPNSLGYPIPTPQPVPGRERIQFAPGATAATVSGFTSAIEPARYILRANAGQTMRVDLTVDNANAYITVLHPTGGNMAGADGPIHHWSGVLPVTGDYVIEVLNPGTGLANFNLTVAIQ